MESPVKGFFTKVVKYLESDCLNFVCYKIHPTSIGAQLMSLYQSSLLTSTKKGRTEGDQHDGCSIPLISAFSASDE